MMQNSYRQIHTDAGLFVNFVAICPHSLYNDDAERNEKERDA